jgi:hypothetical protein
MKKIVFFCGLIFSSTLYLYSQNIIQNNNIYDILDKWIILDDNWAGQSFTLVYENEDYYIYRRIFGSGVAVRGIIKYNVIFDSDYRITFSEIVSASPERMRETYTRNEIFKLFNNDNGFRIYLNDLRLFIERIE